jgi:hypothetical protein
MKSACKPVMLFLFLILTGCAGLTTHEYVWNEYPIAPDRISSQATFTEGQKVSIVAGKANDTRVFLGSIGSHQYYGSRQLLTDGIVVHLGKELRSKGLDITSAAEKSLEIAVARIDFETGVWKFAAILEFTVKLGNGKTRSYSVRNSTPTTVERAYDGAVALAVIKIINDAEVLNYIKE